LSKETTYQNELKSITKNAGITALGLVVLNVMSFVNNAIITRTLGADQYCLYVLATRILEFLMVAAALGLNHSLIRFVSMYAGKNDPKRVKGTIVYVIRVITLASVAFAVLTVLFSKVIANQIFDRPDLLFYLKILMIALPFGVLLNTLLNVFIGLKQVKYQVLLSNLGSPLLFFILISTIFLLGYRLDGLVWMHIISIICITFAAWLIFRKTYLKKVKNIVAINDTRKLWNYNLPVYAAHFANTAFRLAPIFIMGYFLSNEEIGIFNVSYKVGALVLFSMSAFRLIFLPTISELFAKKDIDTISGLFKTVTKWIFTFGLIIFAMVAAFDVTILKIFGDEFATGTLVLLLVMSGELVNASTGLVGAIILMSGRSKVVLVNSIIQFAMIAGLAWWLTPTYGSIGTALAYAISMLIMNTVRVIELYRFEKIHPYKLSTIKPAIATLAGILPVYLLSRMVDANVYLELIAGFILFMLVFLAVTLLLRLDKDDRYILNIIFNQIKGRK
jgi:O-antigen/teichoic acid export membrane protein